jgi:flagellar protein FlaG
MLVESTQAINRFSGDLGVSGRAIPLSSSVEKPASGQTRVAQGESSPVESQSEDSITLSDNAESSPGSGTGDNVLSPERGNQAEDQSAAGGPTALQKIKQSIEDTQETEREKLTQIAENVTERLNDSLSLRFSQDKETGAEIFQLVEPETGDVVRQIPAEDVLEFMKKFEESVSGLIISQQA